MTKQMSTIVEEEERLARRERESEYGESWLDESNEPDYKESTRSTTPLRRPTQNFRVLFPIGDGRVSEQAFEFALQTAQRFSATLVLIYLAKPLPVSSGLLEYAKVERIMDFEWLQYESVTTAKLESFGQRADEAGVRWQGTFSLSGMHDILKSHSGVGNTLVVLNRGNERINGRGSKLLSSLSGFRRPMVKAQILLI